MVYCFGNEVEASYDVLVDVAAGKGKTLEVLSNVGERVVNLDTCHFKYFEEIVQEVLKGVNFTSCVLITEEALKLINEVAIYNRQRYFNVPQARFELIPMAPAMYSV